MIFDAPFPQVDKDFDQLRINNYELRFASLLPKISVKKKVEAVLFFRGNS